MAAGKALATLGLDEARGLGLRCAESVFLNLLMLMAEQEDDPVLCLKLTRQCLAIDHETGDRRKAAPEVGNLGNSWLHLGHLSLAQSNSQEALRLIRAVGNQVSEAMPLCDLSTAACWQGDDALALALARSALEVSAHTRARNWEVTALQCVGDADLALGRHAAAVQSFERALALACAIVSPQQDAALTGLARVALSKSDAVAALQHVEPLLAPELADGLGDGALWPGLIELTCQQALDQSADSRAPEWLQRLHDKLQARAARITDPDLREGFLNHIPHHREIQVAWASRSQRPGH